MPNFAIHDNRIIFNVIVAESKEIVEEVTQLNAIETNGRPWIDWFFDPNYGENGGFVPPKPKNNESWILNYETLEWEPPIPMPETDGPWEWDEESRSWKSLA